MLCYIILYYIILYIYIYIFEYRHWWEWVLSDGMKYILYLHMLIMLHLNRWDQFSCISATAAFGSELKRAPPAKQRARSGRLADATVTKLRVRERSFWSGWKMMENVQEMPIIFRWFRFVHYSFASFSPPWFPTYGCIQRKNRCTTLQTYLLRWLLFFLPEEKT